jgi:hypothetical protein
MAKGNPRKESKGKEKSPLKGGKDAKGAPPKGKGSLK